MRASAWGPPFESGVTVVGFGPMRELKHFLQGPRACGYLRERPSTTEYRLLLDVSPAELEEMLIRGWRRFGPMYFRPVCEACAECVAIRLPLARFAPTGS